MSLLNSIRRKRRLNVCYLKTMTLGITLQQIIIIRRLYDVISVQTRPNKRVTPASKSSSKKQVIKEEPE